MRASAHRVVTLHFMGSLRSTISLSERSVTLRTWRGLRMPCSASGVRPSHWLGWRRARRPFGGTRWRGPSSDGEGRQATQTARARQACAGAGATHGLATWPCHTALVTRPCHTALVTRPRHTALVTRPFSWRTCRAPSCAARACTCRGWAGRARSSGRSRT